MMYYKPVLAVKLSNAIKRACPANMPLDFAIRNVRINGAAMGATGFVTNPYNKTCVWVSTDNQCCQHRFVYRFARDTKDHTGLHNIWCDSLETLAENIVRMLSQESPYTAVAPAAKA